MRSREIWRMRHENETSWFVLLNVCYIAATYALLQRNTGYFESNPIARWFYHGWGIRGMIYFKLAMVLLVVVSMQIVARKHPQLARAVLIFGSLVVAGVFVYSFWLGTQRGPLGE